MWLRTDGDGGRRGSHRLHLAAGRGARKLFRRRETLSGEGSGKGSCHMSPRRQHLSRISVAGALRCEAPIFRGHTVLSRDEVLSENGDDHSRRRDACDAADLSPHSVHRMPGADSPSRSRYAKSRWSTQCRSLCGVFHVKRPALCSDSGGVFPRRSPHGCSSRSRRVTQELLLRSRCSVSLDGGLLPPLPGELSVHSPTSGSIADMGHRWSVDAGWRRSTFGASSGRDRTAGRVAHTARRYAGQPITPIVRRPHDTH